MSPQPCGTPSGALPASNDSQLLLDAKTKAGRLLIEMQRLAAEAKANPPPIGDDARAAGEAAMDNAVESARRMLSAIEQALAGALDERTGRG